MKMIKGSDKGFFAVCNDTARHISHCLKNNEQWFVNWGNETLYYDSVVGNNVWEYFFEQTYRPGHPISVVNDYIDLILLKNNSFRDTMHFIYTNYFKINAKVQNILASSLEFFSTKTVLGVHIRRTDKFLVGMYGTTQKHTPVDLRLFKEEIDKIINNFEYVYLATDCQTAVQFIKDNYGKKVIFNHNAFRGDNSYSIHNNFKNVSGYKKGLDVLTDVILLSKCKHLIRSTSNVSVTSLYLNPDLTYLNLNEKYHNDSEADIL